MHKISGLLIVMLFAMLTVAAWGYANRPSTEPAWPRTVQGFAFQPYQKDQDAIRGDEPTVSQIEADLELLEGRTHAVRTYSTTGTLGAVPALARPRNLSVTLGAWLDADRERNAREVDAAITLAQRHRNVTRIIVGNEVVLRGDLPMDELVAHIERVRAATRQPVSTAEPWHVWISHPELAQHVDFIAVHMLPYWEGVEVEVAVGYVQDKLGELRAAFPGKPIVIGEVGWPSAGRTRQSAVATVANQALFLRRFLHYAEQQRFEYFVMEAFDQPWKSAAEGKVGAYWGVYDADREQKFAFNAPIVRVPHWHVLAAASVLAAAFMLWLFYFHSHTLRNRGRSFLAVVVYATATLLVWTLYDFSQQYMTVGSVLVGSVLLVGMLGVIAVLFAEAHEWAEAHWVTNHHRLLRPRALPATPLPKVSIHVPAYNEPPQMLIETLDALARLDYPDYEVLVVDNNTADEAVWRPVEAHCARLGARFRFFHVAPLAGFKAGALNFALRHTAADAGVVAVIDADYVVRPDWLRDLVPAFAEPRTGVVQAPQDYRDAGESAFKAMCYAEYRGFFHIGMVTRNERNAIIQHGTMTLVRRELLERIGWAEWCITEDAELGLRILDEGYETTYGTRSYGRGLMPDTFLDFKKQRARWAFGAMQIMRTHAAALFRGRDTGLTPGQRYHFVAGWLPWLADGLNVLVNVAALVWSLVMVTFPRDIEPPLMLFSVLPLSLFTFKLIKLLHLYRSRVGANLRQTAAAALAGLSLSHTIGTAMLAGLFHKDRPFFRTPKQAARHRWVQAFQSAREEAALMVGLWFAAFAVSSIPQFDGDLPGLVGSPDLTVWVTVLLVQSIPYAAAVLVSLASCLDLDGAWIGETGRDREVAAITGVPAAWRASENEAVPASAPLESTPRTQ